MHNFAANLTMMFNEVQLAARFEQAAKAGFCGVEMLFPYELAAAAVRNTLQEHALTLALFNIEPGNWDVGDRGLAAQKGREDEFEKAVTTALAYADTVGCIRLHAMAGLAATADDETFIGNLSLAARMAEPHGIEILIEPINTFDMPGYHLSQTNHARSIIEAVGAPNVGLQLDLYHRHRMGADVRAEVVEYADITRHIQIAGPPKRCEPDKGDWSFAEILEAIDRSQYRGWIGCEYRPLGGTQDGLGWLDNVEMQPRNSAA